MRVWDAFVDTGLEGLNEAEIQRWKEDGYVLLKNVLDPMKIETMYSATRKLYESRPQYDTENIFLQSTDVDVRDLLDRNYMFLNVIDCPETFPIVLQLMGPYIALTIAHGLTRPPIGNNEYHMQLHVDGGQAMRSIYVGEESMPLQIKVRYFLTDLPNEDMGNPVVIPGSHKGKIDKPPVQIMAEPGDVLIFVHSLTHGYVANKSSHPHHSVIFGYNQMFMRQHAFNSIPDEVLEACTPRQRRLLGDIGPWKYGSFFYAPEDQIKLIVPRIEEHC